MNRDHLVSFLKVAAIVGCVYLFIVGIGGMGHSFKLFGKEFANQILTTTASPFVGLFIGILATALVQSSSTTTSVIVGMVGAGAISIEGAVPMVMGANIGTTITNLLVSLGHITRSIEFRRAFAAATVHDVFNLIAVAILFPIELITQKIFGTGILAGSAVMMSDAFQGLGGLKLSNPLKAATKPAIEMISYLCRDHPIPVLIVSVLLTFGMLIAIVRLLRSMVLEKVEGFFDEHLFRNAGRAMFFGGVLTIAVQSSSITTSLVIPLAGAGILRLHQIFPYTLGANIGTTMTAILAALATGKPEAVSVSFAHLLFNVFGILIIWPIPVVRAVPIRIAEWIADVSVRNRAIPLVLIPMIFFVIPLMLIMIFK